jgi:quercetin dioxygenase-like cupin family protein
MAKNVSNVVETASASFKASTITGLEYIPLHTDVKEKQGSFLFRMAPKAVFPRHRHPAGEELFVFRGDLSAGERKLKAGDFLYSPPGSIHELSTETGCLFLTIVPEAIRTIPASSGTELDEASVSTEAAPGAAGRADEFDFNPD